MTHSHSKFGRDPSSWNGGAFSGGVVAGTSLLAMGFVGCLQRAAAQRGRMAREAWLQEALKTEGLLRTHHVKRANRAEAEVEMLRVRLETERKTSRALALEVARLVRADKVSRASEHSPS